MTGLDQYSLETLLALKRDYEKTRAKHGLDEWATMRLAAIIKEIETRLETK